MPQSEREVNAFGALGVGLKYYAALYYRLEKWKNS
jgi:hypothetical protein